MIICRAPRCGRKLDAFNIYSSPCLNITDGDTIYYLNQPARKLSWTRAERCLLFLKRPKKDGIGLPRAKYRW